MTTIENNNIITIGGQSCEVVEKIPIGYTILTGVQGVPDGYLPISHPVVHNSVKYIKTPAAKKILAVAESGFKTLSAMEDYIEHNQNNTSPWATYRLQTIQEIIPIMVQITLVAKQTYANAEAEGTQKQQRKSYNGGSQKLMPYRQALAFIKTLKANKNALKALGLKNGQIDSVMGTLHNVIVEHMSKVNPYPFDIKIVKHLREEAVYFQELHDGVITKDCKMARWVICDNVDKASGQITFSHVGTFNLDDYGKTWQVYKHKP